MEAGGSREAYNYTAIDANDEVEPRLHGEIEVGVAQDLEAVPVALFLLRSRVPVEAR